MLLLVDLQNDYLAAAGLEPHANSIVNAAATLLNGCRELSVPVVHVWTTVSRDDDRRMPHWKREQRWLCEHGTAGHATPESLQPRPGENVINKTFFSAFSSPELDSLLHSRQSDTVIIAGIHLHACVRQTVLDGYQRGLDVWVADDATGSNDPVHAAISRRYLESRAGRFADSRRLLALLNKDKPLVADAAFNPENVSAAARRAQAACPNWSQVSRPDKSDMVERLAASLEKHAEDLAVQMAREIGKPVRFGEIEMIRTAAMLRAVIRRANAGISDDNVHHTELHRLPHGVVAIITPWNNPVYISLGKIAPAILHGNTVVWKPAPAADSISRKLMGLMSAAGIPGEVVTCVCGDRSAGEALMADPRVNAVTITGSSLAGYSAQESCSRRRIPLQAELGGNNAAIIWPDADLQDAARRVAEGAFEMAGQRCTANRRAIVHESCRDRFIELLRRETQLLHWGDPLHHNTRIGPLVSTVQRDRVARMVEQATREVGRPIQPQASAPPASRHEGAWYPPTIICCDDPRHEIVQEETFGPVLVVQSARDWDQAIKLCNGVRQGLVAALFTSSTEIANRMMHEAQTGIVKVNQSTADAEVDMPFGGWKASGLGPPEHGIFDMEFYTRPQAVYHDKRTDALRGVNPD